MAHILHDTVHNPCEELVVFVVHRHYYEEQWSGDGWGGGWKEVEGKEWNRIFGTSWLAAKGGGPGRRWVGERRVSEEAGKKEFGVSYYPRS